ncbi:hypothetical protein SEA_THERESITA_53 [Microbacterium phage Theresita]|nr:hypothetical protein SEA_THERESITA_53 [Microbacterium phage Theresita]
MPTDGELRDQAWIERVERAIGRGIDGGARVAVREVLWEAYDKGAADYAVSRKASGEPATALPSALEIVREYEARVGTPKSTETTESTEGADAVSALRGWWEQTAHDEVAQLVAKMTEYGGLSRATDLTEIGRDLVAAGVGKGPLLGSGAVQEGWLQELGIYFYVRGKFARWQAAIIEGRPVSDDTLLDIGIYVRMAQRVRHTGGWPV